MQVAWDGFDEWSYTNGISRRGYQGGGLDGNNSKKLLDKVGCLENVAPLSTVPMTNCLTSFESVVNGCFGFELDTNYEALVNRFKEDYKIMDDYAQTVLEVSCGVSWKVHIITAHLVTFLDRVGVGLGRFAEQTSEAAHAALKPTIRRFCVNEKNKKHGEKLLRAVVDFSSSNI